MMDVTAGSSIGSIVDQDHVASASASQCCSCCFQSHSQHHDSMMVAASCSSSSSTAVDDDDAMELIPRHHRCRRRHHFSCRGMTFVRAVALLLLAGGSASVFVLLRSSSSSNTTLTSLPSVIKTTSSHNHPRQPQQDQAVLKSSTTTTIQQTLSNAIQFVPLVGRRRRRRGLHHQQQHPAPEKSATLQEDSKPKTQISLFSAEAADLVWENYLESAIVLHPLQRHRNNNLRRSEEHSPRKNIKDDGNEKEEEEATAASLSVKKRIEKNQRVAKEVVDDHQHDVVREEDSNQWSTYPYWMMSLLLDSLLGSPLLAFCGIIFLIFSLVVGSRLAVNSSPSRRKNSNIDGEVVAEGVQNRIIILDEDEAEIVEFYEKELTKLQMIPFLQDDDDENKPTAGTIDMVEEEEVNQVTHQHQRILLDSPQRHNPPRHRSASDSSLMRHHHLETEARRSMGDLYYLMVLQTLIDDESNGDESNTILQLSEAKENDDEYCAEPMGIICNVSSLTEDEGCHETDYADVTCNVAEPNDDNDDLTSFKSAQSEAGVVSQEQEIVNNLHLTQDLLASHSAMSSLTSDGYDIEAACINRRVHEDASTPQNTCETHGDSGGSPRHMQASRILALTAAVDPDQNDARSNHHKGRRHCNLVTNIINTKETKEVPRRVSFCNEVKIRRIPSKQQCRELSSESYLYIMLFTVAVVIWIFSLMPANPTLSPIRSMDRVDIFQRANTILSSQWDVEL